MPFLTIAGIEVLVTDLSEREPEYIGDAGRSFSGAWRGDTSGEIRAWQGTGLEVAASKYHELRSAVRRGIVVVEGAAFYGGGPRFMRVTMSGDYIRDGAGWLLVPSFTVEDAQVHDLALRYEPGLGGLVHSRTSTATYVDAKGVLQTAASGVLRDAHYIDGVRHTLLEPARTNLILHSEAFDNAAWSTSGTPVITANNATAPDGATTADKTEDDSTTGIEGVLQAVTVANDSVTRTASVFVKRRTGASIAALLIQYAGGGTVVSGIVHIDPGTGDVGVESGNAPAAYGVEEVGDYWRVWASLANNASGNTTCRVYVQPARVSAVGGAADASLTGYNHFWGAMLEAGAYPTSYLSTAAATVSRAADIAYIDLPAPIEAPTAMAVYARFKVGATGANNPRIFWIGKTDATAAFFYVRQESSVWRVAHNNGSTATGASVAQSVDIADTAEVAGLLNADGSTQVVAAENEGTAAASSVSNATSLASTWTTARIYLNSRGGSDIGAMALRDLKVAHRGGLNPVQGTAEEILTYLRHV